MELGREIEKKNLSNSLGAFPDPSNNHKKEIKTSETK